MRHHYVNLLDLSVFLSSYGNTIFNQLALYFLRTLF